MRLNKKEKDMLIFLLKNHLKEVKKGIKIPNPVGLLAVEVKYKDFIENIIKKLE